MSIFSSVGHFLGNILGVDDEEKKKKQQQAQKQAPTRATPSQTPNQAPQTFDITSKQPDNGVNLVVPGQKPKTPAGFPVVLQKATPDTSAPAPAPKKPDQSLAHKLTHNPVTNFAGDIVKPIAEFGHALTQVPRAVYREVQNKPIDDIQRDVFGTNDQGAIAKKIISDTVNVGLTVGAPGLSKAGEATAFKVIPRTSIPLLRKAATKVAPDAAIGAGFGANSAFGQGGDAKQIATAAGEGAALGAVGSAVMRGIPLLKKAVSNARAAADEPHPGVRSVNPNRAEDIAAAEAKQAADAQAEAAAQAQQAAGTEEGDLASVRKAEVAAAPTQIPDAVPQPAAAVPPEAPVVPAPATVAPAELPAPVSVEAPAAVTPGVTPQNAPVPTVTPGIPVPAAATDVAPLSHDALVKNLGPVAQDLKGQYSQRQPINLDDLKNDATGKIANMSDDEVLNSFHSADPATVINDSQSFALARAALDRFSKMPDNPQAVQQVTNLLDAMDRYKSKSGEALRIAQEEFDNMPLPMKVRYLVKKIDSANVDVEGYSPLARDPERANAIEAQITAYLSRSQDIAERASAIEARLGDVAEAAKAGQPVEADIGALGRVLEQERMTLAQNNGELVKYYSTLVPGSSKGQAVNDFARRAMLSSFTGRINDILTTGSNIANLTAQNVTQGVISKGVNLVKGAGTVTDTFKGGSRLVKAIPGAVRKTVGEARGNQYIDDVQGNLRNNTDLRSGLQKARGPIGRTVQAATEFATNLSEGVRDQRLYQLADQEGRKAGLSGDALKHYSEARSFVPSRQMRDTAEALHKEINNLNENPVSRTLNRISAGIEGKSALGGFLKNQVLPFTSWLGGNIWNSVTDKNVVASSIKLVRDVARGDTEGAVRNLARTINGAGEAYALGYLLTQTGVLTNQDAEGYNDAGAYFHIGDRYIPVGFVGFFAPNIILGNAAHQAINDKDAGNPAEKMMSVAENSLVNFGKSLNVTSALGADNNLSRALEAGSRPGADFKDGAATFLAGAAGQFLPALGSDVNAILNNGVPLVKGVDALNPSHEKADTKVVNPNSPSGQARDVPKSAVAGLVNRVPVASQLALPRKAGVAAPDLVDRTTRGDRDTNASKTNRATVKTEAEQAADWKKRDVPNFRDKGFEDAVEARVQRGDYEKASEALQAKLDDQKKNKDIPGSKNKIIEDEIKQLGVLKQGKFEPSIRDLYKSTAVSEWRNMGDPENENYDPDTYQKLFDYDSRLAAAGISGSSLDKSKEKYMAKKPAKGKGKGSGGGSGNRTVTSNTIGSTPDLGKVSFGDLSPQKAGSVKAPVIQKLRSSDVIKKRKISVSRG